MMQLMFQKLISAATVDLSCNHEQHIIAVGGAGVAQQSISEYTVGSVCVHVYGRGRGGICMSMQCIL